jgi:hypothetical protein
MSPYAPEGAWTLTDSWEFQDEQAAIRACTYDRYCDLARAALEVPL